jgi:hypothetical protein
MDRAVGVAGGDHFSHLSGVCDLPGRTEESAALRTRGLVARRAQSRRVEDASQLQLVRRQTDPGPGKTHRELAFYRCAAPRRDPYP